MMGTIGGALASINAARDIAMTMIGLRDTELLQTKTIELNGLILQALGEAIEARQSEATQINRIGALEAEITRLKAWGAERDNYEMKQIDRGAVVYMLKPDKRSTEPPHWLCPTCYGKGEKGFFQSQGRTKDNQNQSFKCGTCGATTTTHWHEQMRWLD
jgi:DNA-directed RNA polymerase subunit M/transcription elongation factor TFIIS